MLDEAGRGYRGRTIFSRAGLRELGHEALFGVTELDLLAGYPGEPFQEFVNAGAAFDILEQRPYWDAGVFEQPLAAALTGDAFDRVASAPIQHAESLWRSTGHHKALRLIYREQDQRDDGNGEA